MISFIVNNLATIIVGALVGGIIIFVSVRMVRDKMSGRSSCGGCSGCPCVGSCQLEQVKAVGKK